MNTIYVLEVCNYYFLCLGNGTTTIHRKSRETFDTFTVFKNFKKKTQSQRHLRSWGVNKINAKHLHLRSGEHFVERVLL